MFTHRHHTAPQGPELCGQQHATTDEARDCEAQYEQMAWESVQVYCSLCDGIGHGQPGYGPCPLEERGYWEAIGEADWEAARGVISFEDAYAAAMA